jgi:serine/threonine protein kinase
MCAQNHTIAVDYFALGVIGYEFMNGVRPYLGKNRKEIKEKIMAKQAQVKKSQIPKNWSLESADFINRCLQRKPSFRLGLGGTSEVKEHSWFKYFPWKDLYLKKIEPSFIPDPNDNFDNKICKAIDKIGVKTQERYLKIINSDKYKNAFCDFEYFNRFSPFENNAEKNEKIINPHEIYEIENKNIDNKNNSICNNNNISHDINLKSKILNLDNHNNMNKTFIKIMGDERYSSLRKKPNSQYTRLFLNGNKKSANKSFLSGNSSIVNSSNLSNSGTQSNTRHSNEIVKDFY